MISNPTNPRTAELLAASVDDASRRIVLREAHVVRMDEGEDDLPAGDLLIRGDTIEAVGPDLSQLADNATICVDLSGYIVCPGFIDSHVHA